MGIKGVQVVGETRWIKSFKIGDPKFSLLKKFAQPSPFFVLLKEHYQAQAYFRGFVAQ